MFSEFYHDYKHYKRWNYNNPNVNTRAAQESKILRQTHIIEKGMSLSHIRKGFGQEKITILFEMLDRYIALGFDIKGMPFQNAIHVLNEYVKIQREMDYENPEMLKRLSDYQKYINIEENAGTMQTTREVLMKEINQAYPEFFSSRHSIRQFSERDVSIEEVKKAVEVAKKAPTACNRQASHVYMYTNAEINRALGELIAGNTGFDGEVKNYLVVTADVSAFYDAFERNQIYVEAGLFTMALVEALHYYGIASCILQNGEYYKKNQNFKKICGNIPDGERIVLFIAIGYYKDEFTYAVSMRKNVDNILTVC